MQVEKIATWVGCARIASRIGSRPMIRPGTRFQHPAYGRAIGVAAGTTQAVAAPAQLKQEGARLEGGSGGAEPTGARAFGS